MKLLNDYFALQNKIYAHFGYQEDWVVIPIQDRTKMFWKFNGQDIQYAETMEKMQSDGEYYEDSLYTQRFLPRWVYEAPDYTMICVDTHTDGNKFLAIFDNAKRREPNQTQENDT